MTKGRQWLKVTLDQTLSFQVSRVEAIENIQGTGEGTDNTGKLTDNTGKHFGNIAGKGKKLLITSIFSFSRKLLSILWKRDSTILRHSDIFIFRYFQYEWG